MGRFSTRAVLFVSVAGLVLAVIGGGLVLGFFERSNPWAGIWLAVNVVTTTGFGSGPATTLGQMFCTGLLAGAVACWSGVLLVVLEVANMRFQKRALVDEALRPLAKRPHDRLFHVN